MTLEGGVPGAACLRRSLGRAGRVNDRLRTLPAEATRLLQLRCPPAALRGLAEVFGILDDLVKARGDGYRCLMRWRARFPEEALGAGGGKLRNVRAAATLRGSHVGRRANRGRKHSAACSPAMVSGRPFAGRRRELFEAQGNSLLEGGGRQSLVAAPVAEGFAPRDASGSNVHPLGGVISRGES